MPPPPPTPPPTRFLSPPSLPGGWTSRPLEMRREIKSAAEDCAARRPGGGRHSDGRTGVLLSGAHMPRRVAVFSCPHAPPRVRAVRPRARAVRCGRCCASCARAAGGGGGGGSNARGGRRQRAKTSRPARRRTREVISTMRCGFLRMHCEMVSQTGGPAGPVVTFPSRHERGQRPPLIFLFSWRRRLPHSDCNRPGARAGPLEGERLSPCMVHPVVVLSPPVLRWVGRVARWQPGSW